MTPEERAASVVSNCTGPINIRRYACDALGEEIAVAIRAAVAEEREACATLVSDWDDDPVSLRIKLAAAIRARAEK